MIKYSKVGLVQVRWVRVANGHKCWPLDWFWGIQFKCCWSWLFKLSFNRILHIFTKVLFHYFSWAHVAEKQQCFAFGRIWSQIIGFKRKQIIPTSCNKPCVKSKKNNGLATSSPLALKMGSSKANKNRGTLGLSHLGLLKAVICQAQKPIKCPLLHIYNVMTITKRHWNSITVPVVVKYHKMFFIVMAHNDIAYSILVI